MSVLMVTNTITLVKLIQKSNMVKDLTNFEKAISSSVREKQINISLRIQPKVKVTVLWCWCAKRVEISSSTEFIYIIMMSPAKSCHDRQTTYYSMYECTPNTIALNLRRKFRQIKTLSVYRAYP